MYTIFFCMALRSWREHKTYHYVHQSHRYLCSHQSKKGSFGTLINHIWHQRRPQLATSVPVFVFSRISCLASDEFSNFLTSPKIKLTYFLSTLSHRPQESDRVWINVKSALLLRQCFIQITLWASKGAPSCRVMNGCDVWKVASTLSVVAAVCRLLAE